MFGKKRSNRTIGILNYIRQAYVERDFIYIFAFYPHMIRLITISIAFMLMTVGSLSAQIRNYNSSFGFRTENDAYLGFGSDRYYTNGLFINYSHAIRQADTSGKVIKKVWEAEAGQSIYNAQTGAVPDISYVDRPFAGFLYGSAKINWFKKDGQQISAGLTVGTIGPNSLAQDAQELLHDVVGFYEINGWQYQVKNELGVNAQFEYKRLLARTGNSTDFTFSSRASLGTNFTGAAAGVLFRAGDINELYQSASAGSRISNQENSAVPNQEFFFYTQPMLQIIGYDATIQGGVFRDDKGAVTYKPKRLVYSQEVGVRYAKDRWMLSFSAIFKTKELKTQVKSHQYGSASLFYSFGR